MPCIPALMWPLSFSRIVCSRFFITAAAEIRRDDLEQEGQRQVRLGAAGVAVRVWLVEPLVQRLSQSVGLLRISHRITRFAQDRGHFRCQRERVEVMAIVDQGSGLLVPGRVLLAGMPRAHPVAQEIPLGHPHAVALVELEHVIDGLRVDEGEPLLDLRIGDLENPPVAVLKVELPGERDEEAAPHRAAAPRS